MLIIDLLKEYLLIIQYSFLGKIKKHPYNWINGEMGDVVLIPGINENYYFLSTLGNELNNLGYKVHVLDNWNSRENIKLIAEKLSEKITKLNFNNAYIIAHSKGGLVAKYYLDNYNNSNKVKKIISISTPYGGSKLARLNIFNSLNEMSLRSEILSHIIKNEFNNQKIINIYPKFDNHVIPNKNLYLEGAKENIMIDIVGHTRILKSKELFEIIKKHID